jgi:hypothetical protein
MTTTLNKPRSLAPAASALLKNASTSSTYRWMLTGDPPNVSGALPPYSGNSSDSMMIESPRRISA